MIATTEDKAVGWGILVAALMAACVLFVAGPAYAATFTVNRTGDAPDANLANAVCDANASAAGNQCTLRAAIQEANDTPGADNINFNIAGGGTKVISPASELPMITGPLTIDGYTQPGAKPNTRVVGDNAVLRIVLRGPNAGHAIQIGAANSTVRGLVINHWGEGIRINGAGATGNRVTGNFIGTNASGTQDLGNGDNGVVASGGASRNTVGGTSPAARNIISGNDAIGVAIEGTATTNNKVIGNYLGTNADGNTDLGNGFGVDIVGAPNNTVGGTTAKARNVISGNSEQGVNVEGVDAEGNKIMGNRIGTNASGTQALGNGIGGVRITAPDNILGGLVTATSNPRNVISGNGDRGVLIDGVDATGNKVMGNYIGTDASGTRSLRNTVGVVIGAPDNTVGGTRVGARNVISGNQGGSGIIISTADAMGNQVMGNYIGTDASGTRRLRNLVGVLISGASLNIIGGPVTTTSNPSNRISGNSSGGVVIQGAHATGNFVISNSIYSNNGLGIDLEGNGVTPNDVGDGDTGPNDLQNFPVLTSAKTSSVDTTIKGTLNSAANTGFNLQFFSSPTADPSGFGEGKTFKFEKNVVTNGSGNRSFTFETTNKVPKGQVVTATAINQSLDDFGDTSEFSNAVTVN